MLEKLGLPSKPSNRGAAWVVDASHCQGCSGQFTFINRKHHCRRCGGLFCGSCTQQRMILRGQGDSPVRICEPCKQLEEAARFELRYGHKNKAAKGNMKHTSINEEEVLNQILGTNKRQAFASGHGSHFDVSSNNLQKSASSASTSSLNEESATPGRDIGIPKSLSVGTTHGSTLIDIESTTPEELRQQAVEQKNKYRILKGEGKSEEALQAFKHGRELERQAASLELALRKNRRMASKASTISNLSDTQKTDDHEESRIKKPPSQRGVKEGKDDLSADLRELGWSDADLHDADNKPAKPTTLEGELLNLLGEIPKKPSSGSGAGVIDRTQVTAHKKKALLLKREGKLTEAKEELKKAKILEKQIEEQELLGEDEDSDDELSVLIRSMKDDKPDELLLGHASDPGLDFEHLLGAANDFALDDNFEVTDEDLKNPELAADLKSFGWSDKEDEDMGDADSLLQPAHFDLEALREKALALKREALGQKRAGNVGEAMALLKEAKLLEKELEIRQSDVPTFAEPSVVSVADEGNITETVKMPPKSKMMIQRELLNVKKKALALRREGHVEEAEEELKKGKILEEQLEEMENGPKRPALNVGKKVVQPAHANIRDDGISDLTDEVEAVVTDQDMNDPALLSVLENLGWNDDNNTESISVNTDSFHQSVPSVTTRKATRSKAVVQKELLGVKRNALALRRQGRTQEADEELERAKVLENELSDIENANSAALESHDSGSLVSQETSDSQKADSSAIKSRIIKDAETWSSLKSSDANLPHSTSESLVRTASQYTEVPSSVNVVTEPRVEANRSSENEISSHRMSGSEVMHKSVATITNSSQSETVELSNIHDFDTQKSEILVRKRKAVVLKREGKLVEAREELRQAKLLEKSLEDAQQAVAGTENASTSLENSPVKQEGITVPARKPVADVSRVPKPVSGRDRFKLQQESLSHKRNALKLRREGKIAESEAEFELAKALESQLEELGGGSSTGKAEVTDDASVEDLFDPQLMSALKSIGWGGSDFATPSSGKSEPKISPDKGANTQSDKNQLEEQIKGERLRAHKGVNTRSEKDQLEEQIKDERLRALNFKRAGKQGEALEALRSAKRLEKKLGLLTS